MNILFVCEDNCALSLMAESILAAVGRDRFGAFSAGCNPGRAANRYALDFLAANGLPIAGLHPKALAQFRSDSAPRMAFIITLCDAAAAESFADWPGAPIVARWHVADEDYDIAAEAAHRDNFWTLMRRIKIFASLPHGTLNRRVLQRRVLDLQPSYL